MKNKRTGVVAPTIRETSKYQSQAPQKKVYLHPDQIFSVNVTGDLVQCFKYCATHNSIIDYELVPETVFKSGGYIAIEFGKRASVLRIRYSKIVSDIRVFIGDDFETLIHQFTLTAQNQYADCLTASSAIGKVCVLVADSGNVPYFEFVAEKAIRAMPNSQYQNSFSNPIETIKIQNKAVEKSADMAMIQKSIFPSHRVVVEQDVILINDRSVRISPSVINGNPVSYDEVVGQSNKLSQGPGMFLTGQDCDLAAFVLARYGRNKNYRYNKAKDKYVLDQDFVFVNNAGMKFENKTRVGLSQISSFGLWPTIRIDSPDDYCELTNEFNSKAKAVDIVTPINSIPMRPSRDMFYFVYRNQRKFWADRLVIEINSRHEARSLKRFLSTVHHYAPNVEIEVIINYKLHPAKWMSCLCFCGYHKVSSVLITNFDCLFDQVKQKWETIHEPNDWFLSMSDWIETVKNLNLTLYEEGEVVDRAIYKGTNSYEHIEQFMLNWLHHSNSAPIFETELTMPITYRVK